MKKLLTLVVGAVLLASSVNAASLNNETVASVINEMTRVNDAMKGILLENDGLVTANLALVKKNKLWSEQLNTRLRPQSVPLIEFF